MVALGPSAAPFPGDTSGPGRSPGCWPSAFFTPRSWPGLGHS